MKSYSLRAALAAFITVLSLTPLQAKTLNLDLNFEEESSLTALTDRDWEILKETAMEALDNSPDGSTHIWKNEQSGNSGIMKILSTDEQSEIPCRNAEFFNTAGGKTSRTRVKVCKRDNNIWSAEGPLSTTSVDNISSEIPSDMPSTSTEMTRKTLGKTSDYCQKLFQDIERLKGKPIQRSAARDLHEAECQR